MITIEELRKVYSETFEGAIVAQESQAEAFDAALLAVARYVEKKVREQEIDHNEIERYDGDGKHRQWGRHTTTWLYPGDRVWVVNMQSVAPSVVPE